jgi:hypothetical protein
MRRLAYIALLLMACNQEPGLDSSIERCVLYAVFETGKSPVADVVCANGHMNSNSLRWLWLDGSMDTFDIVNNQWILDSVGWNARNNGCRAGISTRHCGGITER